MNPRHTRCSSPRSLAPHALALVAVLIAMPAPAARSCLLEDESKVCLDLRSLPSESVQPSGLAGKPTYVHYEAVLNNASLKSTRFLELRMNLTPATGFTEVSAPPTASCAITGSEVVCRLDKLTAGEPMTIKAIANAPAFEGESTAAELVNSVVFGWQGRTATDSSTVAVDSHAGATYVPPNTEVTLVTAPESTDPAQQVTEESPLWGKMTLPPRPTGYFARIAVIFDGPDSSIECVGGMFYAANGGPAVCRDGNSPRRWVFTELPDESFTDVSPVQFTLMWDTTIVPAAQLPPSDVAPTGTPPFAIFHNQTEVGVPYGPMRAFSNVCDDAMPRAPCLSRVARLDNADWAADFLKANDGSDMNEPLAALKSLLDYLINVALAGPITVGPVVK